MKTILFYWSKGADTRRAIIKLIAQCQKKNLPCYLNLIAEKLKISHVAAKNHVDLMIEEGYIKSINPDGKPVFLELTEKGLEVLKEIGGA